MNTPRLHGIVLTAIVLCVCLHPVRAQIRPSPAGPIIPNPVPQQLDTTFAAWDSNHDGSLSLQEFRAGATGMQASMVDRRLHAQFNAVDANKDGAIDVGEYAKLLLVKRAGAAAPPLATFDANRNQKLEYAEYTDLVQRMAPARVAPRPAGK